jgi:mannose-6-phosphate isomerase-like protein (cupin superfamily)
MSQDLLQASAFHRRHTEGLSYWGPGDLYTFLVTGEESGGAYFSMLAIVPPNGGPPPHIHEREDETFYVLEGTPTFRIGDEQIHAGPGDFVNVPKGVLHNFHNGSDQLVRMILTFTPAGIEHFFQESLERAHDLTQECPDNLAEVGARFMATGPRYGIEFLPGA